MDQQQYQLQQAKDFQALFLDERGQWKPEARVFFSTLATFCGADRPRFKVTDVGAIDPLFTLKYESRREVYCFIEDVLSTDTVALERRIKEREDFET